MRRATRYAVFGMIAILFIVLIAMIAGCGKSDRIVMGSEAMAIQTCKAHGGLKALHATPMSNDWAKLVMICNNGAVIQLDYKQ